MKRSAEKKSKDQSVIRRHQDVLDIIFGEALPQSPDEAAVEAVDRIWRSVEKRRTTEPKEQPRPTDY
jgi:hypothetical protein